MNAAPPQDLSDNVETTAMGVGAHQLHLALIDNCKICHDTPTVLSDPAHIDGTPNAELKSFLQWDRTIATCQTTCHSDSSKTYVWNDFE